MFTGIIEETGTVKRVSKTAQSAVLEVLCHKVPKNTKLGDSIAINGVCQTVTRISPDSFTVQISAETLSVTTFGDLKQNDTVNLERALTPVSRLGGHIVSGHVDGRGKLLSKKQLSDFYNMEFEIPEHLLKYIVHKGSITINGISLTVAEIEANRVKIAVIPHTYENTNLSQLNVNDFVNIETDILGKYVEKILSVKDNNNSNIDMNFLQENGFL